MISRFTKYVYLLLFILEYKAKAVDPQFTQFYSAPLYLSPSFAGATRQHRISSNYRQQWLNIPGRFKTFIVGYDYFFSSYNSGVGLMFMSDQAGSGGYGFSRIDLLYSYDFELPNSWHIRPGISFLYKTYNLNFYKLKFFDQISSNNPNIPSTENPPEPEIRGSNDGAVSGLAYNRVFWFGFTADHLLKPNQSFFGDKVNVPVKYSFYGGARLLKRGDLLKPIDESLSLAYMYRIQGDYQQLDFGFYWNNSPLVLGVWYRGIPLFNSERGDALCFLVGTKFRDFSFGYSYDFTISNLINSTSGSHEISLIFEFLTQRKKKYHAIPCPEF